MEADSQLQSLIDNYFKDSEYKVIDIILRGEKGTRVLEIFVDNVKGINIDDIAGINRDLNKLVDGNPETDLSKLVVSSPGIDRPIKYIWQLQKHLNRGLEIELNNSEHVTGVLKEINENGSGELILDIVSGKNKKPVNHELRMIRCDDIKSMKVKISFSKK